MLSKTEKLLQFSTITYYCKVNSISKKEILRKLKEEGKTYSLLKTL
jgi:hypothetical protein